MNGIMGGNPYGAGGGQFGGGMSNPMYGGLNPWQNDQTQWYQDYQQQQADRGYEGQQFGQGMQQQQFDFSQQQYQDYMDRTTPYGGQQQSYYANGAPRGWVNPNYKSFDIEGIGKVGMNTLNNTKYMNLDPRFLGAMYGGGVGEGWGGPSEGPGGVEGWSPSEWTGGGVDLPDKYSGGGMDVTGMNQMVTGAIDANKPWFDEQAASGMADVANRLGATGMLGSSAYANELGGVQRRVNEDYNRLAMDYRVNAAEAAAARQLEAQQNQYDRDYAGWAQHGDWQMTDRDKSFQQWALQNQMEQSQNQFQNQMGYNQWAQQNAWDYDAWAQQGNWNMQNQAMQNNWMNQMLGSLMGG